MQAVMMVAGKSTRTYPLTLTRPKPLLPIINRPMIYFNLDQMVGLVDEVILIVGYKKNMIENLLGEEYKGISIIYQEQRDQLGTGHAVLQSAPHIVDRFLVLNGDDLFARVDMEKLINYSYGALAMPVANPQDYGVMTTNDKGQLAKFVEKPKQFVSDLVNVGCYILEPDIFDILEDLKPTERGEIELPDAVLRVTRNEPVQVVSLAGFWLPTGYPWYMLTTERYLYDHYPLEFAVRGKVESGASIQGKVAIGARSVVKSGAKISGPVTIGEGCTIGNGAVINAYPSIGNDVMIGENSVVEGSIVFEKVKIGKNVTVSHSVIGEKVMIGDNCQLQSTPNTGKTVQSHVKDKMVDSGLPKFGATLADTVVLGTNVKIASGVKVWPGKHIGDNAIVDTDVM
jgi:UDP-N-acetylglucosamine diphosphorylase / glucose-1-phosphate thymidylyltransferase / UDP-N-acetylgalactosamine diphosphorylase / glucosamine-1-phosphate N-acetyltransferase / galactosamine-1-phosphate N-acetyltransferase